MKTLFKRFGPIVLDLLSAGLPNQEGLAYQRLGTVHLHGAPGSAPRHSNTTYYRGLSNYLYYCGGSYF